MANKVTKKDNFNALRVLAVSAERSDLVEFVDHELEQLAKKAASRANQPTARQTENAEIRADLLQKMVYDTWYRCVEIQHLNDILAKGVGTQRTARLCNDMVDEGFLKKKTEKQIVYFALNG